MAEIPESVQQFYEIAKQYCDWAENPSVKEGNENYHALKLLSTLYQRVLFLPEVAPETEEHKYISKLEAKHVYERFNNFPFKYYWEIFHPIDGVFQWRTSFGFHWGRHATSALRILHIYETS